MTSPGKNRKYVFVCVIFALNLCVSTNALAVATYNGSAGVSNIILGISACTNCHTADGISATSNWDEYADASAGIVNILDRVQRAPGAAGFMPQGGSYIGDPARDLLIAWSNAGTPGVLAPTVTTNNESSLTNTSATLNSTIAQNGASTNVSFRYSTTSSLVSNGTGGTVTATSSPSGSGGDTGTQTSARSISGLSCGTTYYFRAQGSNSQGATNGNTTSLTTNVCSPPTITNVNSSVNFTEGGSAIVIDSSITLADVDNSQLNQAQVEVSGNYASGEDILGCPAGGSLTCGVSGSTLTLSGVASLATYDAELQAVTYSNSNTDNPSTLTRTIRMRVRDNDISSAYSSYDSTTLSVTGVNDAPAISGLGGSVTFDEAAGTPVAIDSSITITDVDSANLNLATVQITTAYQAAEDVLTCPNTAAFALSCAVSGSTVTLSGSDTKANYVTALQGISYDNTSSNPDITSRAVTFAIRDTSNAPSLGVTSTIALNASNNAPTISGVDNPVAYNENDSATIIDPSITLGDVDNTTFKRAEVEISTNYTAPEDVLTCPSVTSPLSCSVSGALLSITGTDTISAYRTALQGVTYQNTSDNPSTMTRTVRVRVRDNADSDSLYDTTTLAVTSSNDPATVTGINGTAAFIEDSPAIFIDSSVTIGDPDNTQLNLLEIEITAGSYISSEDLLFCPANIGSFPALSCAVAGRILTISGTDSLANYKSAVEQVTYNNLSNTPNISNRTVRFRATDDSNLVGSYFSKTLSVTATNDVPTFVETTPVSRTISENGVPIAFALTLNATDLESDTITWGISSQGTGSIASVPVSPANTGNSMAISYSPQPGFVGNDSFIVQITDGNGGSAIFTVDVTMLDADADDDTILDINDNCVNTANTDQANNDGDAQGDLCDADDDNDGIPDTTEIALGLNPFNNSSTINIPADISTASTGYLTSVNLGSGTLTEGSLTIPLSNDAPASFRPGTYSVNWSINGSNIGTAQTVNVVPQINFYPDQIITEGTTTQIQISLNGNAITYPVTADYSVSGTSDSADHNAVSDSISIASGTSTTININTTADMLAEGTETLILTLSNPVNAVTGSQNIHMVSISENNIAPVVNIDVNQSSASVATIYNTQGNVTFTANVIDPGDTFAYDWSQSDNSLTPPTADVSNFSVDPTGLTAGVYNIVVVVADNNAAQTTRTRVIRVENTPPTLSAVTDSDLDTINDATEGLTDADNDLIPDYLDATSQPELLPNQTGNASTTYLIQTEPGLNIQTGNIAIASARYGSLISDDDIVNNGGVNSGTTFDSDSEHTHFGGIYDFAISNLIPGRSALVVIPLQSRILDNSTYHKFNPATGWQEFSIDSNNAIYSAPGALGACPAPGSSLYTAGLTATHYCVQLQIQDGGPNDSDGQTNGSIQDPGGIAINKNSSSTTTSAAAQSNGSIGIINPLLLFMMFIFLYALKYNKRK